MSGQTSQLDPQVGSMEKKFFGRKYPKDPIEVRVARLEKEVFGSAKTGPVDGRIIALSSAVMDPNSNTPSKHAKPGAQPDQQSEQPQQQLQPERPQSVPQQQLSPERPQSAPQERPSPARKEENDVHVDYPAVDRLEQQILGRTYPNDTLKSRLGRLELKAFGAVSSTDDLSGRREALEQYAKFYNGGSPQQTTTQPQQQTTTQPQYARNPEEPRPNSPVGHQRSAYDMYGPEAGSTRREQTTSGRREAPRREPTASARRPAKPAAKSSGNPDEMTPAQLEHWMKKQNQE